MKRGKRCFLHPFKFILCIIDTFHLFMKKFITACNPNAKFSQESFAKERQEFQHWKCEWSDLTPEENATKDSALVLKRYKLVEVIGKTEKEIELACVVSEIVVIEDAARQSHQIAHVVCQIGTRLCDPHHICTHDIK